MKLHIGTDLSLPLNAVTEKLAFLGRTGSGKTYAAMKLAELMLEAGAQIVSLDPVGAWHGLRIGGSWNVYIFGGMRGSFNTYLSKLRTLELISGTKELLKAGDTLFE